MTIDNIIEGMQILKKYSKGYSVCAEHDQISVNPNHGETVSREDVLALRHLGWFQEDAEDNNDKDPEDMTDDELVAQYADGENWSAFV